MKRFTILILGLALLVLFQNCTSKEDSSPTNTNSVSKETNDSLNSARFQIDFESISGNTYKIKIQTLDLDVLVSEISLSSNNGSILNLMRLSPGIFEASMTINKVSFLTEIEMSLRGQLLKREFPVFARKNARWGTPEGVPGLVNTLGWEDSPEISRDGEWLIVSTYSPVPFFCCLGGAAFPGVCPSSNGQDSTRTNPACNEVRGTYGSPSRPEMLGGSRVLSSTQINHDVPELGLVGQNFSLPPVAAYGFQRQSDGSFKNPFVIGMDWGGYTWGGPFGFNFTGNESGSVREVIFSFYDPSEPAKLADIYKADLTLGIPQYLGTLRSTDFSNFQKSSFRMTPLQIDQTDVQSNPYFDPGLSVLLWDTEGSASGVDLWTSKKTGSTYSAHAKIPWSLSDRGEFQPYIFQQKIYFSANHAQIMSRDYLGGDLNLMASWAASETEELAVDPARIYEVGGISAVGEPSLAVDKEGKTYLYFAYSVTRSFGVELNIGRVAIK